MLKRALSKEEPNNNNKSSPSKRPKTSEITKPATAAAKALSDVESEHEDPPTTLLKKRSSLTLKDLPLECSYGFRVAFKPAIRDFVGTLSPWERPADADVIRIWNNYFPNRKLENSMALQTIVFKLVDNTVQRWRSDIATAAVQRLNVDLKGFSEQSARATHAAWLLGEDENDRKRPFYYKNYGDGTQPSGMFQSPIVAATLATHLASISGLPEESRLQFFPAGALALSILAVKRALTWAKTGIDTIPNTSEGNFSRANWGDHYRLQDGRYVLTKTASNIVAVINKLRNVHWERIIAEAAKYATERNVPAALKALCEEAEQNKSDFEVEDWDDDFE